MFNYFFLHPLKFTNYIFKIKNYNIFDVLILIILFIKFFKFIIDTSIWINFYELIIWIYLYSLFVIFKFLLLNKIIDTTLLKNNFIFLSLFSSFVILISYIFYLCDFNSNFFWEIKNKVVQPYFGNKSLHFNGFFSNYNLQAYLLIPGYFFLLINKNIFPTIKKFLLPIIIIAIFLTKSKVIILVLLLTFIYFILAYANKIFLKQNILFILFFISVAIFYTIITHFLIVKTDIINSENISTYLHYYTSKPLFIFNDYEIYGSLFYKLKLMAVYLMEKNNYIFFDEINFLNIPVIFNEYNKGIDPHSEYFGFLANYGVFFSIVYFYFLFYFLIIFFNDLKKNKIYQIPYIDIILIICLFLIEAIVVDTVHFQFLWVIFVMNYFVITKYNEK